MIRLDGVTKQYGNRTVVDDVSFTCAPGTVTGLLGQNGAGKTTTLKMLLGLAAPTRGHATISGVPFQDLSPAGRTVGISLDASGLHPGRTVRETLRLAGRITGMPASRADALLEEIGLGADGRKLVARCSLGMRQRLSIGVALIGDPEYLVLDEPVNGLDPGGIAWIRELLRTRAERGKTVLLSSHMLREVAAIADHLVIMRAGRVAIQGDLASLAAGETGVLVTASDQELLRRALEQESIAHRKQGSQIYASATPEQIGQLVLAHQIVLTQLMTASSDHIENLYFHSIHDDEPVASRKT